MGDFLNTASIFTREFPYSKKSPMVEHSQNNDTSTASQIVRSAHVKLEVAQKELDSAQERADKAFERDMQVAKEIQKNIQKLAKFDAEAKTTRQVGK